MNRPSANHRANFVARAIAALCLALGVASIPATTRAASRTLDASASAPRPVEDATAAAVERDYLHGWKSLTAALEANRAELLNENFTGTARQHWQQAIDLQQQSGLSRRIIDHGHSLRVTFYSLDGSALQAEDVADIEIEYRDGTKVLSSEHIHPHYLVLLTPAENSWKIRILEELPVS